MKAEIVSVGTEMLLGMIADTNAQYLTQQMAELGIDVFWISQVGDNLDRVVDVIRRGMSRSDAVIITGGVGPTEDDLPRDAVSRVAGVPLDIDETIVERLRERFTKRGLRMTENNRRQAMVPRGATVLENPNGSAPGLLLTRGDTDIVLLPGPPRELKPMLDAVIRDRLAARGSGAGLFRRVLRITGRPESEVDALVQPIYSKWTVDPVPISTTILAALGQLELHLTAAANTRADADAALDHAVGLLQVALGSCVYSCDGRALEAIVGEMLAERGLTVAVAESCSGGLLTSRLTDVPGSSAYVDRGVVCYSNRAKVELLGVPEEMIHEHGAVSEPVARAMAEGVARRARTSVGLAITGIAGPGGGTLEKPVGTVVVAVAMNDETRVRTLKLFGGREMVKFQSAQAALNMLRLMLQ